MCLHVDVQGVPFKWVQGAVSLPVFTTGTGMARMNRAASIGLHFNWSNSKALYVPSGFQGFISKSRQRLLLGKISRFWAPFSSKCSFLGLLLLVLVPAAPAAAPPVVTSSSSSSRSSRRIGTWWLLNWAVRFLKHFSGHDNVLLKFRP